MNDPVIDLHVLFVSKLGGTGRFSQASPVSRCCVLEQDTFILQPRKTRPNVTERFFDWVVKNQVKKKNT